MLKLLMYKDVITIKKFIVPFICILAISIVAIKHSSIVSYATNFFTNKQDIVIPGGNEYTKKEDFLYVQTTDNFTPLGYQDLLNIFYTVIDNHWKTFTFYCPSEYESCADDIEKISESALVLSNINNFVHPYNSFTNVKTSIDNNGEIIVKVDYLYTDDQISYINHEVDNIINQYYDQNASLKDNLKNIHDYIINQVSYDVNYKENKSLLTYTAYGVLKNNLATCNGYTDLMAIILSKLDIKNFKVAYNPEGKSADEGHVWNAVYIDGKWLHLDLTWDDPVSSNGQEYLYHKYFLVTTEEMKEADEGEVVITEHNYDRRIYQEF